MGSPATARERATLSGAPARLPRMRPPNRDLMPSGATPVALGRAVSRASRLDALTEELRGAGPQGRTSAWLADRLGVSARTVKRDVTALLRAGVPIRASSGPQGGYAIDTTARPSLTLTPDEALAIVVGLQAIPDQPFASTIESAIAKVLRSVPAQQRTEIGPLADRIWLRPGEPPLDHDTAIRDVLVTAVRDHHVVLLDYEPTDGPPMLSRQVEPLGFAHSRGRWFAIAWCRDRDSGNWFQLDHITAAQPTHETFTPRAIRDLSRPTPDAA